LEIVKVLHLVLNKHADVRGSLNRLVFEKFECHLVFYSLSVLDLGLQSGLEDVCLSPLFSLNISFMDLVHNHVIDIRCDIRVVIEPLDVVLLSL